MRNIVLFLLLLAVYTGCKPKVEITKDGSDAIRINQLGYYPKAVKKFVVVGSQSSTFDIVDSTGNKVYSGKLEDKGVWDLSKDSVKVGDFTDFQTAGKYQIHVADKGASYFFALKDDLYGDAYKSSIRAFYLHRASMEIEEKYAGKYKRPLAHPDNECFYHPSSGKSTGSMSSPKGWYDAGDYNKYVVNAGVTVGTMMALYEMHPQAAPDNNLNIPESGNGVSDLLDEIKFELDWMMTMQDADGGVFFKVTNKGFDGMVMPHEAKEKRYVVGKSTAAALNFAAVIAQAGRVWKSIDTAQSAQYIAAAKKAWAWAVKNPAIAFKNPADISTGEYGDTSFADKFYWAATELFISTDDKEFADYLNNNPMPFVFKPEESWRNFNLNLAYFSAVTVENNIEDTKKVAMKNSLLHEAENLLQKLENCPYRQPLDVFAWGSNSDVLNIAVIFAYAHNLTKETKYLNAAIETTDYIFGKNATGYSFVTGYGSKPSMFPHQRLSEADGIPEPVPGWVVGGPNKNLNDEYNEQRTYGVKYPSKEPAKCYVDVVGSYASNEICINWNAPLIFILGYFEAVKAYF